MARDDHWTDAGVFDFEHLIDFATTPGNGSDSSARPPHKQLACARCHAQKLRCVRERHGSICERCFSASLECVERQPQRMGRPVDRSTPRYRSQQSRNVAGRRGGAGKKSASSTPTTLSSTDTPLDSALLTASDLEAWSWPSPPENPTSFDTARAAGDSSSSSPVNLGSYVGPMATSLSPHALLPNFEDLPTTFFSSAIDNAAVESLQNANIHGAIDPPSPPDDPIEQLSKLHLELYQCLTSVKAVEKMKRDRLRNVPREPGESIDTSWSERLFQTTENFISALRAYVDTGVYTPGTSNGSSDAMQISPSLAEDQDAGGGSGQIDTATGLMIVSCYTRLLQIFEVVVFVVETFRDMDCPGSYVQIRFGAFAPAGNKDLHARLLGQYVLHLLDGISEIVDRAVGSRQPYARAISEIRRVETKLKERIATTLH
ncbi:hypothetical protein F4809DRAFT_342424 [Biscogniauxia mediterranea]|nr:hypothetical protein F4809DRAFT_342424 [Biscogniauxia mediterranea]